jgi:hypothetical protein
MPTIAKLPAAGTLSPTDVMPIDQGNGTNGVPLATLFAGLQTAIVTPTETLLGRVSLGSGGPETVSLGTGLVMSGGTIAVGGSLTSLLDGETVDQLQAAAIARDTDSFPVDQGGATLTRQTMAALWTYIESKLPIAVQRVVELTTNTALDATGHNDAILVCSQPLTLSANFANMGSGFVCTVLNLSAGVVTMGTGITVASGYTSLGPGLSAHLVAVTYSGGSIVFWSGTTQTGGTTISSGGSNTSSGGSTVSSGGSIVSSGGSTVTSGGSSTSTATLTFVTAPSGSYTTGQTNVGVNATLDPGTASTSVQFGISTSQTSAPQGWTAGALVNTQSNGDTFWGTYLTMPSTAGTYYCWVETGDGLTSSVSAAFTVS